MYACGGIVKKKGRVLWPEKTERMRARWPPSVSVVCLRTRPALLGSLFGLLRRGRDRGNAVLLDQSIQRGEIFRLDLTPRRKLRLHSPVQLVEHNIGLRGWRRICAFYRALQRHELVRRLNGIIQWIFSALGLGLDNHF